jgi:dipeptidyl aminopeptidase/acylaminoacyl peptidase
MHRFAPFAVVAALLPCAVRAGPPPQPLPLETFFRNPEFDNVLLSPSGRYLATITRLKPLPEARNIVVFDVDEAEARTITGYDRSDVDWFFWAGDERLVFKLDRDYDALGGQNRFLGIYGVDRDGGGGMRLDDPEVRRGTSVIPRIVPGLREHVDRVAGARPSASELLVTRRDPRTPLPEVYRLDLERGGLTRVAANAHEVRKWVADNDGEVRAAIGPAPGSDPLRQVLWYRDDSERDWKAILEFDLQDLDVLGFQRGDKRLLVASRIGRDRFALFELNPHTGALGEPLVEDPEYDVYQRSSSYLARAADGKPLFYQYVADKPRTIFFDDEWRERQSVIDGTLRDTVNTIVGWSENERRFLVYSWSDRQPGRYYLYEPAEKRLEELLSSRSWIDPAAMRPMQPFRIKGRDGTLLHGYLTLPEPRERAPALVVYPHGGPFGVRDVWGFDPAVQFLASRGYAVLQVDFRGSTGYGREHERAGYRRWGLEMQDDVTDAVTWAVESGQVDGRRICIYGAGYGGYSALMGLIRTPKLYRCAIDYGGPVDLGLLYRTNVANHGADEAASQWWRMTLGDPETDKERFFDTSPISHIDQIDSPLLVIHGQLDDRVSIEHYKRLTNALERAGKDFDFLVKQYAGYGYHAEANQIELYRKIQPFLARYLQ